MSTAEIIPAIMIGGAGSRLWPLSRNDRPKQFLNLGGKGSMFQDTVGRFAAPGFAAPWLLASATTRDHVTRQLDEAGLVCAGMVIEPGMRGTAAAIAAISTVLGTDNPDALILIAPADHFIESEAAFRAAVLTAAPIAADGNIVTFGITPTGPETGFGYIAPGEPIDLGFRVGPQGFREKPSIDLASQFVADGCLWNAGIFLFTARTMMEEIRCFAPQTFAAVTASCAAAFPRRTPHGLVVEPDAEAFLEAPLELSIDVAVMEKTDRAVVVPVSDIGWSDVGSLSALWDIAGKDENGNVLRGDGLIHRSRNVLVHAGGGRRVIVSHLYEMVVIDTEDAVIVLPASKAQTVKDIVGELRAIQAPELSYAREARFAWGEAHIDRSLPEHTALSLRLRPAGRITRYRCTSAFETWIVTGGTVTVDLGHGIEIYEVGNTIGLGEGDVISVVAVGGEATIAIVTATLGGRSLAEVFDHAVTMPGRHAEMADLFSTREVA
ncbi:MAG TPA: sugar phosphate nucleotidyltransferase [Devosia sp.]|nr:sugar phosphate nucleotidyltransferase [Devosia sp.]